MQSNLFINSILHHPSAGRLIDELTQLEERVSHSNIDVAKHQEMYENVSIVCG